MPALLTLTAVGHQRAAERIVLALLMLAMTAAAVLRIVQALDIAERSEARLVFQAHHDSLTGLPNRRMMEEHLPPAPDEARSTTPRSRCSISTSTGSS